MSIYNHAVGATSTYDLHPKIIEKISASEYVSNRINSLVGSEISKAKSDLSKTISDGDSRVERLLNTYKEEVAEEIAKAKNSFSDKNIVKVDAPTDDIYRVGANFMGRPIVSDATQKDVEPRTLKFMITGGGPATTISGFTGTLNYVYRLSVPATKWRLRISNRESKSGNSRDGSITISDLKNGLYRNNQVLNLRDIDTTAKSFDTDYVSEWYRTEFASTHDGYGVVSFSVSTSAEVMQNIGGGFKSTISEGQSLSGLSNVMPFDVSIEMCVSESTPVVAIFGSSTSIGVGATYPVADSALSIWAQPRGVIPIVGGISGDRAAISTNPSEYKYTRWLTSGIDSTIVQIGSNDINYGSSATNLYASVSLIFKNLRDAGIKTLFSQTVTSRAFLKDEYHSVKDEYNQMLKTKDLGQEAVWDPNPLISSDGRFIDSKYDSGDRSHFNTAGYEQLAKSFGEMTFASPFRKLT